jgi:hypothetical protein
MYLGLVLFTDISFHKVATIFIPCPSLSFYPSPRPHPASFKIRELDCICSKVPDYYVFLLAFIYIWVWGVILWRQLPCLDVPLYGAVSCVYVWARLLDMALQLFRVVVSHRLLTLHSVPPLFVAVLYAVLHVQTSYLIAGRKWSFQAVTRLEQMIFCVLFQTASEWDSYVWWTFRNACAYFISW